MGSPAALSILVFFVVLGIALLVFLACRAVSWAKMRRSGAEFVGGLVSVGSAINPAEALIEERRAVERNRDDSGEPDEADSEQTHG
jgi:hypothetical protein